MLLTYMLHESSSTYPIPGKVATTQSPTKPDHSTQVIPLILDVKKDDVRCMRSDFRSLLMSV